MGVFAGIRFLCRAGPMCPAEKCVPGGGAHGPRPTGRYVEPRVGDGVLYRSPVIPSGTPSPTSHQRGSAALSFRASAHTGVGIRLLAGAMPTSARRNLTKSRLRCILVPRTLHT